MRLKVNVFRLTDEKMIDYSWAPDPQGPLGTTEIQTEYKHFGNQLQTDPLRRHLQSP